MLAIIARFQFFFYPLIVHLSVIYQVPFVTACLMPLFYLILAKPFSGTDSQIRFKLLILFLLTIVAIFSYYYLDHSIIYLPPILMISLILYPFIRSVLPNNTPLISRFYQLTEQKSDPRVLSYTEKLTWVWIFLISALLLNTIFLTFFASLETWSLFTNFINYLLLLALLVFEWLFRMVKFKKWVSPVQITRQLLTVDQRELFR
jgi:uncharacterized membrane protein